MLRSPRSIPFVIAATDHGPLIVNRLDFHQKPSQAPFGVGYSLLSTASFDAGEVDLGIKMLDWLREFRGDNVVALDCGANIGVHTVEWARHMTGWGEVIAFEPQERIFYALAGNISVNNCFNARAFHAAVGDETGSIDVPVLDYAMPASFGSLELKKRHTTEEIGQKVDYEKSKQSVSILKIDDLNISRVDFMKIDVEGMERAVLDGAIDQVDRSRPYILVEHHKSGIETLSDWFVAADYVWLEAGINLLAVPKGDPAAGRLSV